MEHTTQHPSEEKSLNEKSSEEKKKLIIENREFILPIAILLGAALIAGSILYSAKQLSDGSLLSVKNSAGANTLNTIPTPTQAAVPDSGSAKVSVDNDMFMGSENAPITIVEFSDYQCPFCRKFWSDTLPSLKKDYIDTGKVKFVYRDLPLDFHPGAKPAAEATECAKEQGKYWQVHDAIFQGQASQGQGTIQFSKDDIIKWIGNAGLNMNQLNQCLDSGKYKIEVEKDLADGQAAGVSGTPTFFIGKSNSDGTIDGTRLVGAQPYTAFKTIIDQQLK